MTTQRTEKGEAPMQVRAHQGFLIQKPDKERIMANSTQVAPSRAITVPFHGADLYVVEHKGQPFTPMKPIVEGMGIDWKGQHAKLAANEGRWGMEEISIPTAGGVQVMACIALRKLFGWMAGIHVGKIKPAIRPVVLMYQNECDDVLWQYWNDGIAINPRTAYAVLPDQTISDKQAETLRLLLTENVKKLPKEKQGGAMVKGWSKLKAHFKTDYRHIPAGEFHEAVNILARHVSEWELVDDAPMAGAVPEQADAVRTKAAFDAASQASAAVQSAVFNAVLSGNDEWKYSRWMLAFIDDSAKGAPAYVRQMERDTFVTNWTRLVRDVATGECMCSSKELLDMAYACMQRMAHFPGAARMAA